MNILIVEDEQPLQRAVKTKMEKEGFEVITARSFAQAVDYLTNIDPVDAIWLDHYLLGKGTGLDFLIEVKKNDAWKSVPVFVVTNTATPDKQQSYLQLGVEKYLVKASIKLDEIVLDIKKSITNKNG